MAEIVVTDDKELNGKPQEEVSFNVDKVLKPTKLKLPKGYIRKPVELLDMDDCLTSDTIRSEDEVKADDDVKQIDLNVLDMNNTDKTNKKVRIKKDKNKTEEEPQKKTRTPTAYNVFVKETLKMLNETRTDLTPKERFNLAIKMWSDNKPKVV
jgi:YABBY protein